MNALLAVPAEAAARADGLRVVRFGVDLFRPVPLEPLVLETRPLRRGRRIAVLEMLLRRPGAEEMLSRATALLLRPAAPGPPPKVPPPRSEGPEPRPLMAEDFRGAVPPGFHWSLEVRLGADERGSFARLATPLDFLAGTPLSDLQRSAALADLTTSVCGLLRREGERRVRDQTPINADTTLYWERPPRGTWLEFRPQPQEVRDGIGVCGASLHDAAGRQGRVLQASLGAPPRPGGARAWES